MTKFNTNGNLTLRALDIPSIHRFSVGFDNIFDDLMRINMQQSSGSNYPPYNILKHDDDNFTIELAVAGFNEGDISITLDKNILTISGEQTQTLDELDTTIEYLHRGISARSFNRTFTLAEHVEVLNAHSVNGILKIKLIRNIPEDSKPKQIDISYKK